MTLFKNDYSKMNDKSLNELFDYHRTIQCTSEQDDQFQVDFNSLLN
jgi:hypothetical protein